MNGSGQPPEDEGGEVQVEVFEAPVRVLRERDLVFGEDEPPAAPPSAKIRERDLAFPEEEPSAKQARAEEP